MVRLQKMPATAGPGRWAEARLYLPSRPHANRPWGGLPWRLPSRQGILLGVTLARGRTERKAMRKAREGVAHLGWRPVAELARQHLRLEGSLTYASLDIGQTVNVGRDPCQHGWSPALPPGRKLFRKLMVMPATLLPYLAVSGMPMKACRNSTNRASAASPFSSSYFRHSASW